MESKTGLIIGDLRYGDVIKCACMGVFRGGEGSPCVRGLSVYLYAIGNIQAVGK